MGPCEAARGYTAAVAIPTRADVVPRAVPAVTLGIAFANLLVFLYTLSLGADAALFVDHFGLVPRELRLRSGVSPWITPLTALFLHGGWLHLLGNLFYLWIFGPPVEERLGWRRFLGFYLGCGLIACAIHVGSDPSGFVPTIGASGAVSGVLGAYAIHHPRGRLLLRWPRVRVPATWLLGLWIVAQVVSGWVGLRPGAGATASWAHLGGFLAGAVGAGWIRPRSPGGSAAGS